MATAGRRHVGLKAAAGDVCLPNSEQDERRIRRVAQQNRKMSCELIVLTHVSLDFRFMPATAVHPVEQPAALIDIRQITVEQGPLHGAPCADGGEPRKRVEDMASSEGFSLIER